VSPPRPIKVFYSWQSEAHQKVCRNLIEDCLKRAIKQNNRQPHLSLSYREDEADSFELVFDKDTQGVPGSPDIVESILRKIREADIFIGDLTIVRPRSGDERAASNANVLMETGYALGRLGRDQVILAFNTSFGRLPEDLPFNLRQTSLCGYEASPDSEDLTEARKFLVKRFSEKLQKALDLLPKDDVVGPDQVLTALRKGGRSGRKLFRAAFENLMVGTTNFATEQNVEAADSTLFEAGVAKALAHLRPVFEWVDQIAENEDLEALRCCVPGFEALLNRIWDHSSYSDGWTDLPKFVCYCMFCYISAAFIREEHYDALASFLEERYAYERKNGALVNSGYGEFSRDIRSLGAFRGREYYSPLGEFMASLCADGQLPLKVSEYVDAEIVLWLRSEFKSESPWQLRARDLLLRNQPKILHKGQSRKFAQRLVPLLGLDSLDGAGEKVQRAFVSLFRELGSMRGEVLGMYTHDYKPEQFATV